ncbi:MAG: aldo/keto reductase [Armatimonadota bacterium]|nr:aldo/keto reductase [Armatimonadota bacterium]
MEYRLLGRTGERLSIVGMGGIVVKGLPQSEADMIVAEAIERGVNYFDVAPSYGDAEERLGGALKGKRDGVFLACKTGARTCKEAMEELDRSLKRLQTDCVDLYQMHGLDNPGELDIALGPGGALEGFVAAREAGKVRYIGITGHSVENLSRAARTLHFDTALFPVNFAQFEMENRGPEFVELAKSMGVGRLAIKAAAKERWAEGEEHTSPNCWYKPLADKNLFGLALRYSLSQDITAVLPPGDPRLFRMALDVAGRFEPLDESGIEELRKSYGQFTPLFVPSGVA